MARATKTKTTRTKAPITIKLDAHIDENDRLIVSCKEQEPGLEPIVLRPERGLADLVVAYPDVRSVNLEVRDFVQRGTVYKVYAATLEDDGRTVAAHWEPSAAGQMCAFAISSPANAGMVKLFIGALPLRKDAPVPAPLSPGVESGSGPFPISTDPPPRGS